MNLGGSGHPRGLAAVAAVAAVVLAAAASPPAIAQVQAYPTRPIRLVLSFAGGTDVVGRLLAQGLSVALGQPVLSDQRLGAGGNIAGELVARALPDGYTILLSSGGALGGNLAIYTRMPYDPLKDLAPVGMLVYQGNVLIVNPSVPAKTVADFITIARTRPGVLNYGSGGNGSSQHMSGELLVDLLGGQVDLMFQTIPEALQQVKAGKVRALGVTGSRTSAALPGVPTIAQALSGFEFEGWMGVALPPATPAAIIGRLNAEQNRILGEKDTRARLSEAGLDIAGGTAEQMSAMMKDQAVRMVRLAKEAGIRPVD